MSDPSSSSPPEGGKSLPVIAPAPPIKLERVVVKKARQIGAELVKKTKKKTQRRLKILYIWWTTEFFF